MGTIKIKRTGRTWGIFDGDVLVEGGFFSREAAERAAEAYDGASEAREDFRADVR